MLWVHLDKQVERYENTDEECSLEKSHHRISSTVPNKVEPFCHNKQYHRKVLLSSFHLNGHTIGFQVRTTLYSIINSTTGKYCSVAFIWMVTLWDFMGDSKARTVLKVCMIDSEREARFKGSASEIERNNDRILVRLRQFCHELLCGRLGGAKGLDIKPVSVSRKRNTDGRTACKLTYSLSGSTTTLLSRQQKNDTNNGRVNPCTFENSINGCSVEFSRISNTVKL